MHDALPCLMRGDDFRIVRLDGAGEHDGVLAFDVLRLLAEFDGDAEALQTVGFGAWLTVRTIDLDTLLMQHFSEHAHARAANADEMGGPQIIHAFLRTERRMGWIKNDGTGFTLVVRHDCSS